MKQQSAYGLWPSPLTPAAMCTGLRFGGLAWDTDGERLMWLESSDGQGVLRVGDDSANAPRSLGGDLSVRASGVLRTVAAISRFSASCSTLWPMAGRTASPGPRGAGGCAPPAHHPAFERGRPTRSPDGHWIVVVHSYEDEDT